MKTIIVFDQAESYGGSIARILDIIRETPEHNYIFFTYIDIRSKASDLNIPNLQLIKISSRFSYQKKLRIKRKLGRLINNFSYFRLFLGKFLALFDLTNEILVTLQIRRSLKSERPDILISNSNLHAVPLRLNKTLNCYHIVIFRSLDQLSRWTEHTAKIDHFISISSPLYSIYKAQIGIPDHKASIIGSPFNALEDLERQRKLPHTGLPYNPKLQFTIVCAARICKQKGQLDACKAFHKSGIWKKAKLIIVGGTDPDELSQDYLNQILTFIERENLNDHITLVGFQKNPLVWINSADVALHCATEFEGLGGTVIEAMQLGKITIASDNGGPSSYIENGKNGFLYKSNDVEMLSQTLSLVYHQYPKLGHIQQKAMLNATEQFSTKSIATRLSEIFDNTRTNY
ncbi:glycosyltransferase family 4 protein [Marinobacter sp.]|uniref:glycosyltransferase family 4 protein n=1 Tax=Marinobacter sp. TaxID=50741 RepID=UPI003566D575